MQRGLSRKLLLITNPIFNKQSLIIVEVIELSITLQLKSPPRTANLYSHVPILSTMEQSREFNTSRSLALRQDGKYTFISKDDQL